MVKFRGWWLLLAVALVVAIAGLWSQHRTMRIPYRDNFAKSQAQEWTAMGGTWRFKNDMVINRSDERGAKLLTGSEDWTDYKLHAEIQMLGTVGDAGVVVRVTNAAEGINGYSGYYAGLQFRDGALVLGSSHDDWVSVPQVALPGGIYPGPWFSMDVVAVGCTVGVHVRNSATGAEAWTALREKTCWRNGRIGLRSVGLGAAWRNVHVDAADTVDLQSILAHVPSPKAPQLPTREDEYASAMLRYYDGSKEALRQAALRRELQVLREDAIDLPAARPIRSLRELSLHDRIRIRGVVSLLDPLYVQDQTGGVRIAPLNIPPINVGDEVEVTGSLQRTDNLLLEGDRVKVIASKAPLLPVSVSSTQAASGEFEGSYVELRGTLRSVHAGRDGESRLEMDDGIQRFEVLIPPSIKPLDFGPWSSGSLLLVRGVCSEPADLIARDAAFVLLAPSDSDVEVVSGPPWDRGVRLYLLIGIGVVLAGAGFAAYLKSERSKLQAASSEREQIAMEIHDTLAQSFAGVSFNLQSMKKIMEGDPATPETLLMRIRKACVMAAEAHREASDRMGTLHPDTKDEDLLRQLKRSSQSMLNDASIEVAMESTGTPRLPAPIVRDALIRIGREIIANTLRHSRATELKLAVQYMPDRLQLSIADNGDGFDSGAKGEGFGLASVRVRAKSIGASVRICSTPGRGTAVHVDAPYGGRPSVVERFYAAFRRT